MTKTEARQRATNQLRFGWFKDGLAEGYVYCPTCREQVKTSWPAWARPAEIRRALHTALVEHLTDYCEK